MLGAIKYNDGSLKDIPSVPVEIKTKYKETFEIDMRWIMKAGAYRGKWIDQSQSLNIFFSGTSGKELSDLYTYAWEIGLKTTYYLRSLGATQVEKSTVGTAGTHLRKDGGVDAGDSMSATGTGDIPVVAPTGVVAQVVEIAPEAPRVAVPTPSPFVAEVHLQTAPVIPKPQIRLHVAEEAVCESCQ